MSCELTQGYNDRQCTNGKGGIRSVMFIELEKITSLIVASCLATTIDLEVGYAPKLYKLKSNLSNYTAPPRRDEENGTTWYEQVLSMVLNSDSKELRCEIDLLLQNEVAAVVEKANGEVVLLGAREGLKMGDGSEYGSGTVKQDRNGHVLAFNGNENDPVPEVDGTVYTDLLAAAA